MSVSVRGWFLSLVLYARVHACMQVELQRVVDGEVIVLEERRRWSSDNTTIESSLQGDRESSHARSLRIPPPHATHTYSLGGSKGLMHG